MILQEKKQTINLNFELALNNSVIMFPVKNYVDRPNTKSAFALTNIFSKYVLFLQKKHDFMQEHKYKVDSYIIHKNLENGIVSSFLHSYVH